MSKRNIVRRITVNSIDYVWRVQRLDPQMVVLRVWLRGRARRDAPLEVQIRYDDPWLNFGPIITAPPEQVHTIFQLAPITPGQVRTMIEAALTAGWDPESASSQRRFARDAHGKLVPIAPPE